MTGSKILAIVLVSAASASAAPLFYDGMDYGGTTGLWKDNAAAIANWPTTSSRPTYEATGLSHASLDVTGGNYSYIFTGASLTITRSTSFNPGFESASAGDTYWFAALAQWGGSNTSLGLQFTGANTVDTVGFKVSTSGSVILVGSNNGNTASDLTTGKTAVAGQTHLLLARATFGSGDATTRNSTLDFWMDPSDVSDASALGTPDYTTGADSKFGRSGSYSSESITGGSSSTSNVPRLDEIYFTKNFSDLPLVPEPTSLALLGTAVLVTRRRR